MMKQTTPTPKHKSLDDVSDALAGLSGLLDGNLPPQKRIAAIRLIRDILKGLSTDLMDQEPPARKQA
ncbi:MAG: hypothetical protein CMB99_16245 [Flavobacteriaceae bacterium]|nr:hypothetical protein [Flavobacteriaceae bacterium]